MKLPSHRTAFVQESKLTDYLLSEKHVVGRTKAKFFRKHGYDESKIESLKEGLLKIAHTQAIKDEIITPHGKKYIIDGILETPLNQDILITTVWIIDKGKSSARFVTAYPA